MTDDTTDHRFIWVFLIVAFGWAWGFWVPLALHESGVLALPDGLYQRFAESSPAAWGPLIGAVIVAVLRGGMTGLRALFARFTRVRFSWRWYLAALLLIPGIVGAAGLVATLMGDIGGPSEAFLNPVSIPIAFVWIFFLGGPLQEEAGWRGVLADGAEPRIGALGASLIAGAIWGLWHLPLFYMPREDIYYNQPIWGLIVSTMLLSVLITWVYNNTRKSLFAAMLMHTSWNWANYLFTSLHTDSGGTAFLALLVAVVVLVSVVFGPRKLVGRVANAVEIPWRRSPGM